MAWTFGLLCDTAKKSLLGIVFTWTLLGFRFYSISGVQFDLILILRSQLFECLRETLYKHALEHLEAARPEKTHFFFFLRQMPDYY